MRTRFAMVALALLAGCTDQKPGETIARTQQAINGGNIVGAGSKPTYIVRIRSTDGSHTCTGVLISTSWVLTAGHCVTETVYPTIAMVVVAGDRTRSVNEGTEQESMVAYVVRHPEYEIVGYNLYNDLALIRLATPFTLNANVSVVSSFSTTTPIVGSWGVAYGWGATVHNGESSDALRSASMYVVDNETCEDLWQPHNLGIVLDDTQFCAFQESPYVSIDKGDSGGPFLSAGLTGISSMVRTYVQQSPGIFVDVSKFTDWINEVVYDSIWLEPIADTYVRGGSYADANYGNAGTGTIKNDASVNLDREIYAIYDLSGISEEITDATIWQHCRSSSTATPVPLIRLWQLYSAGETWEEDELTWNNRYLYGVHVEQKSVSSIDWTLHRWTNAELAERVEQKRGGLIGFRFLAGSQTTNAAIECSLRESPKLSQLPMLQLRFN